MTTDELKAEARALAVQIDELSSIAEPTDEQRAALDEAEAKVEPLAEQVRAAIEADEAREARDKQLAEIRSYAAKPAFVEGPTLVTTEKRDNADAGILEMRAVDGDKSARTEINARAREVAAESRFEHYTDTEKQSVTELLERNKDPKIAGHILRTSSPEYHDMFEDYVSGDPTASARFAMEFPSEYRATMSLTAANGGVLVPFTLDPTIILSNAGAANPFRAIADQVTITTDDWNGVSSAGVTGEWLAENTEAADASPTFSQPSITAHKAAAYVQASIEVTQDSNIASQLGRLIADAKDRLEATAFATGSGTSQPFGIVTALGLTTTSRVAGSSGAAGAADLVAADIFALDNDLGPRYRPNASFVANKTIWNTVRRLANVTTGTNPSSFWTDFGGALPSKLIGYPVYESSAMDSTVVSGSNDDIIVLGDFKAGYKIVDRVGLAIVHNPLTLGSNRRPDGGVGWFAYWRVGGDSVDDAAFRMLRV